MTNPKKRGPKSKGGPKGVYKYYQIIVRKKEHVTPEMIEGMRRALWNYLNDTPMIDIIARKISKPHNTEWRGGN